MCFGFIENLSHRRLSALKTFANGTYRQDIISGNLGEWIVKGTHTFVVTTSSINSDSFLEYQKANRELGDFTDEHPFLSYGRRATPTFEMFTRILGDLPMVCIDVITMLATS